MEFRIEDYQVYVSRYNENTVEIEIKREENFLFSFTVNLLIMSDEIKKVIKKNELATFGYVRFNLDT